MAERRKEDPADRWQRARRTAWVRIVVLLVLGGGTALWATDHAAGTKDTTFIYDPYLA